MFIHWHQPCIILRTQKLFSSFLARPSHNVNSLYNKEKVYLRTLFEKDIVGRWMEGCRWWWIWWRQKVFPLSFRGNLFPLQIEIFSRFNFHSPKKVLKSHIVLRSHIFWENILRGKIHRHHVTSCDLNWQINFSSSLPFKLLLFLFEIFSFRTSTLCGSHRVNI